eukprot:NODE_212_length_1160_cov_546.975799_g207_i0.p1 GENE.NODE_212_length_1160_cov_546.975799_g207_i0~~NODE_212_length_1160_cov_546.975799_g207_i0.p1  ORF type:complete len:295 (+),score=41.52 NODE_212_length_1160_cov_546.975799_g207_i0:65-949(+)
MSGGIYPNPPKYENTDDYIHTITGSAPRKSVDRKSLTSDDFDRKQLYGTIETGGTKYYPESNKSCGTFCAKFFLFILNTVFLAAGGLVIAMGIIVITKKDTHIIGKTIPIIVILIGVGLMIFAIYGYITACCHNRCLLFGYLVLLILLLVLFLSLGIFIAIIASKPKLLHKPCEKAWEALVENMDQAKHGLSPCDFQHDWKCSGFGEGTCNGPQDAKTNPDTCPLCPASDYFPSEDCWTKLQKTIKKNMIILIIGDLSAFCVVLFAIIFSCCLCSRKGNVMSSERLLYKRINEL